MTIRVLVADDHKIFMEGLRSVLEKAPDIEIVGHANDGLAAVELTLQEKPDVVVMDIAMPRLSGIEATRRIRSGLPATRVLCLSMHAEEAFLVAALEAGASGYLLKECALEELTKGIRAIFANGSYFSPTIASALFHTCLAQKTQSGSSLVRLTSREREILQLIAEGCATKQIADKLGVSVKSVCTHHEHVMDKLDIHSVAGQGEVALIRSLDVRHFFCACC
jgi:DNA-binding NarL/FixJ family response regulator